MIRVSGYLLLVVLPLARLSAQTRVETFSASGTVAITMPGVATPSGTTFNAQFIYSSLDFAPGAVVFNGTPVDFDGSEAAFMGGSNSAQFTVPNAGTTVPVRGTGVRSSAMNNAFVFSVNNLQLGPSFGPSQFDIPNGQTVTGATLIPEWNSAVIPALNGAHVLAAGSSIITSVDAINGLVTASSNNGSYTARFATDVPTLSEWAIGVLLLGLAGIGWCFMNRRSSDGSTPAPA